VIGDTRDFGIGRRVCALNWTALRASRQATYDLRRLRRKGLITRLPHSHHYQLTPFGRRAAVLFTKAHGRVLAPGLALLDPLVPADLAERSPLASAWRQLDLALTDFVDHQLRAA